VGRIVAANLRSAPIPTPVAEVQPPAATL